MKAKERKSKRTIRMPEFVYETWKDVRDVKHVLLSNSSVYNQAFENLMVLHNALAENIARHIRMTDNVASTAGEMHKTVKELGKNYRLFLIGQILLYVLVVVLILKEVIK